MGRHQSGYSDDDRDKGYLPSGMNVCWKSHKWNGHIHIPADTRPEGRQPELAPGPRVSSPPREHGELFPGNTAAYLPAPHRLPAHHGASPRG